MDNCTNSWAEIDLRAIRSNVAGIKKLLSPQTRLMSVVKANAYGHGMLEVARTCLEEGATYLGVANLREALTLREEGITAQILVLGYVSPECAGLMVDNRIDATVFDRDTALVLSQAAVSLDKEARVHLKIDTGMGRIGFKPDEASLEIIKEMARMPGIVIQGAFSHLATADAADKSFAWQQAEVFQSFVAGLKDAGISIPLKHLANSAAIMEMPELHFDMVRAGIITYGLYPSDEVDRSILNLIPAMRLRSRIIMVKNLPSGGSISYGRTFICPQETKVATVPVGYGDGYHRLLSNRSWISVKGQRAPLIGTVCMDQCMFDVSEIDDVKAGDEVVLFGRPEDGITADDLARLMGTINYEIVCAPSSRVSRIYIDNNL
ncbi:MAG: alanine racemase [Syntrophomonadaceae bacterium]|nr:alanine racemase [Syntrophomonadaceae bacterium]